MVAIVIGIGIVLGIVFLLLFAIAYIKFGWWRLPIIPQIVGPDEMAILEIVGTPEEFLDSGWHWIPFWFSKLRKYPRTLFNLDYLARKVVTAARGQYGKQELGVDSVAYVQFPQYFARGKDWQGNKRLPDSLREIREIEEESRQATGTVVPFKIEGGLVQILRSKVPTEEKALQNFTEEAVAGALRVAFGQITWVVATENIKKVRDGADTVFKSADGALIRAGFDPEDLSLTVKELILPRELTDALPDPDAARLRAKAAVFVSQARAIETVGSVINMMAESREKTPKQIREEIEADPEAKKEFLDLSKDLIVRRMGIDGKAYVDIRVEGAGGIEQSLLNLVAAWQRMPGSGRGTGKEKEKDEEEIPAELSQHLTEKSKRALRIR